MDDAPGPAPEDDGAPRPRILWRPAARVGSAITAGVATVVDLWQRVSHREPRRLTDLDQARRARAARLIGGRGRLRD
ncbi:hypothetical protein [Nocardioides antri]|uniref:hypothetical protein n=1 Tax=Nocardioides antri TaxID=2607659 RepID=UPI00165FCD96|nr:hypothetical protein [Nocardioides antri]